MYIWICLVSFQQTIIDFRVIDYDMFKFNYSPMELILSIEWIPFEARN